jgi:hypothetical protein
LIDATSARRSHVAEFGASSGTWIGVTVQAVRALVIASAGLALASAFAGAADSRTASGLRGVVMRGPTTPVCHDDTCEAPAKGLVLQFRRNGLVKAQVKTSQTGRYLVKLRPGRYAVTTPRLRPGQRLTPELVRVPRGRVGRVDLHLETGVQ